MYVLTPSGPRNPDDMDVGDEVLSRDAKNGRLICNRLETRPQWVDRSEFARWWNWRPPAFRFFRINRHLVLSRSQSIWANGFITHVAKLKIGDVIYTERNGYVRVWDIEETKRRGWWRFDVDGDHSYILDGALVHNASRFWVSGTGTWDSSTTTHWGSSSGTADNASVPGSADAVTLNGSSGGGTVTLNFGGTITIQSLTMGAFTGTFENSVNNNNITVSATGSAFSLGGTATRTFKMGSATYTMTATSVTWEFGTTTNATFTPGTSTIAYTGGSGIKTFNGGDKTYGTLSLGATSGAGNYSINNSNTFATFNVTAPNWIEFQTSNVQTVTNALNWVGSSTAQIMLLPSSNNGTSTIAAASGSTMQYCAFRGITFSTGSPTATNSFNLLNNTGVTITGPGAGGGGASVIGS